jgi:hypothetical protein
MTSRFNILMHGEMDKVEALIGTDPLNEREIAAVLANLCRHMARVESLEQNTADTLFRVSRLRPGKPGTGACICKHSPEMWQKAYGDDFTTAIPHINIMLDHRCAQHGQSAQPSLWGRNKGLEFVCTPKEWASLGITYTDKEQADGEA